MFTPDTSTSASVFVPDVKPGNILAANYVLSHLGIKTQIIGRGKVVKQSLVPGTVIKKGAVCSIVLE